MPAEISTARSTARAVAVVSIGSFAALAILVRPSAFVVALPLLVAVIWGVVPHAIDAWCGGPVDEPVHPRDGTVTYLIRAGGGDASSSRAAVVAASTAGPTIVVASDQQVAAELGDLPVPVLVDEPGRRALAAAADLVDTDAVFVMSARAFADHDALRRAAGHIRAGASWATGRADPFNRDGFAPSVRDRLGRRLRASARAGGTAIWEPEATVVATRLLRDGAAQADRPLGALLREGDGGVVVNDVLSVVAEPVDGPSFWRVSLLRRRAAVADVADALRSGTLRARLLSLGLLLREFDGVPLVLWLLAPWLATWRANGLVRAPATLALALVVVPAVLRWWSARRLHRLPLHPLDDVLALAYDAPASVLSVPAAITRRARPPRFWLPPQPIVVAVLVFGSVSLIPLFTEGTTARRSTAAGLALTELAALWLVSMRVLFQRNWSRARYRIRARLPVRVDGSSARTRDVAPAGVGVSGELAHLIQGQEVAVEIDLADGSTVRARGTVVNRWRAGDDDVVGLGLEVADADWPAWVSELERSAWARSSGQATALPAPVTVPTSRGSRLVRSVLAVAVCAISAIALSALCLAGLGLRPLVVRSGSMQPTLQIGDVVLVEDVRAVDLDVGDVATLLQPDGDTLTHRVTDVERVGGTVLITTRGDANTGDETTPLDPDALVGRVRWQIPAVGRLVAAASTRAVRWTIGVTTVAAIAVWLTIRRVLVRAA